MNGEKTVSEKIIRLLVWISILAFTLISVGTAFVVYQFSLNGRMASLHAATTSLAADVDGWFQYEMANCAQTAQVVNNLYDFHREKLTMDERAHIYAALTAKNRRYLNVYDAVGQDFVSGANAVLPANYDATKRGWYMDAIKTPGKSIITPPYVDAITGTVCTTFARTIAPDSGERGVFGIDIALDQIRDYVGEANKDPQSRFFIVDERGRILVHPDSSLMPDKHGTFTTMAPYLWRKIMDGGSVLDLDIYGKPAYYISSPLHSTGWRIVSTAQLRQVVTPIIAAVVPILAAFAVIIACIVILLKHRLNNLVSAPLDSLRRIVDDIAAGNDHVLIEPERYQAEFRLFAESFKQMCALRYAVRHDSLSGLLNRGAFFSAAEHDYALMRRQGTPGCALMMDLDHFKQVNDTHGHSTGDRVIIGVAEVLRARLRATDISGRYGGEEFCVWLPNTNREGAMILAEELRKDVAALQFTNESGQTFGVTISIGLADSEAANIGALLEHADEALYQAKRGGRNRVEVYQAKDTQPNSQS